MRAILKLLSIMVCFLLNEMARSGFIDILDYQMNYVNSGYATEFNIRFSLQSGLGSQDYLKIKFPFALHSTQVLDVPDNLDATLAQMGETGCSLISQFRALIFQKIAQVGNIYYFRFLDDQGLVRRNLVAGMWYKLKITIKGAVPAQPVGMLKPIALQTISDYSLTTGYLQYDFNFAHPPFEFVAAPASSLAVVVTMADANQNVVDQNHEILVDVTPSILIKYSGRIVFIMTNNEFAFSGLTCTSQSIPTSPTTSIPALTVSDYSCQIDSDKNIVTISMKKEIEPTKQVRFRVGIRNPKKATLTASNLEVRTMKTEANIIIERFAVVGIFSTLPFTWGVGNINLKVHLGSGIDLALATKPIQAQIMRGLDFYNALRFYFTPSRSTPQATRLQVVLQLDCPPLPSTSIFLEGSISENLPRFDANPVQCTLDQTVPASSFLACENVGVLSNQGLYHIGIKIFYPYDAGLQSMHANFGKLAIYTYNPITNSYDPQELIAPARAPGIDLTTVNNMNNVDWLYNNAANGYQYVHSQLISQYGTLTAPTSSSYGVLGIEGGTNTDTQRVIFTINPPAAPFSGATPFGFSVVTTHKIEDASNSNYLVQSLNGGTASYNNVPAAGTFPNVVTKNTVFGEQYTRLIIAATNPGSMFRGGTPSTFSAGPFRINVMSCSYASDNTFDFYGATFQNVWTTPAVVQYFAFNSYTVSKSTAWTNLPWLKFTMASFWVGTGSGLNGDKFPAHIRIIGYLKDNEQLKVKKLAVFFDNLDYFPSTGESDEYGRQISACASSMNDNHKCITFSGQRTHVNSIYNLNRMEIDVESSIDSIGPSSQFQILIPVKSITNLGNIKINFATLIENQDYGENKPYYMTQHVLNAYYLYSFTPIATLTMDPSLSWTVGDSQSYCLNLIDGPGTVGGTSTTDFQAQINIGHIDALSNVVMTNSGGNIGGAYQYVSDWNMIGEGFYAYADWIDAAYQQHACLPYQYQYTTYFRYGFFCPNSQLVLNLPVPVDINYNVKIIGFKFPYTNGQKIPTNTWSMWSNTIGSIVSFRQHQAALDVITKLSPGFIKDLISPKFKRAYLNLRADWGFTTANDIPSNGKVIALIKNPTVGFTTQTTARCELKANKQVKQKAHTCAISLTSTVAAITITFTLNSLDGLPFPADTYTLYQYEVDVNPTVSVDVDYQILTKTNSGQTIDQSQISQLDMDETYSQPFIQTPAMKFSHNSIGTIGVFKFSFTLTDRAVYREQNINFDLTYIIGSNADPTSYRVFIKENNQISFLWKSFNPVSPTVNKLIPQDDILALGLTFTLEIQNIIVPSTTNTYPATSLRYNLATLVVFSTPVAPLATPLFVPLVTPPSAPSLVITKYLALAASVSEIELTITSSLKMDVKSTVFVNFPVYFNSLVLSKILSCSVNGFSVLCFNYQPYQIAISSFPKLINPGTEFQIKIYGVSHPPQNILQKIFVMTDTDQNYTTIEEYISVTDTAALAGDVTASQPIDYFPYETIGLSPRIPGNYSWTLTAGSAILENQLIVVDFPREYGSILKPLPPKSCQIFANISNTISNFGQNCTEIVGSRVYVKVTAIIPSGAEFTVNLDSIINTEDSYCTISQIMISIVSEDKLTVLGRSTVATSNSPKYRFRYRADYRYLDWYDPSGNRMRYNYQKLVLTPGVFSDTISLRDFSGLPLGQMILYSLIPDPTAIFTVLTDEIMYPGQFLQTVQIGCPSSTIPNHFDILFSSEQPSLPVKYSEISILQVTINKYEKQTVTLPHNFCHQKLYVKFDKTEIQLKQYLYKVTMLGLSNPIIFNLEQMIPYSDISIDLEIVPIDPLKDPKLVFNDTRTRFTRAQFSRTHYVNQIFVISLVNITQPNSTIGEFPPDFISKVNIKISGTNANSYKMAATKIQLVLIKRPIFEKAALTYTQIVEEIAPFATTQIAYFQTDIPAQVYWHCSTIDAPQRDLYFVIEQITKGHKINPMDYYLEQVGVLNVEEFITTSSTYINNIRAKLQYRFTSWAIDSIGRISQPKINYFLTQNNNGRILQLSLIYKTPLTIEQQKMLSCWLCQYFLVPCLNVITYDSIYCSIYAQYNLTIKDEINIGSQERRRVLQENGDYKFLENRESQQYDETDTLNQINFLKNTGSFLPMSEENEEYNSFDDYYDEDGKKGNYDLEEEERLYQEHSEVTKYYNQQDDVWYEDYTRMIFQRMLQTTTNTTDNTTTTTNSTDNSTSVPSSVATTNSTLITSNATNITSSTTNSTNSTDGEWVIPSDPNPPIGETYLYFLPLDEIEADISWDRITRGYFDSNFKKWFNANFTKLLPELLEMKDLQQIIYTKDPDFFITPQVKTGQDWIYVSGLDLREKGIIYSYLGSETASRPFQRNLKFKLDASNKTHPTFQIQYYNLTGMSLLFQNLNYSTTYQIFILASVENPGLWGKVSQQLLVTKGVTKTSQEAYQAISRLKGFGYLLISIIMIFFCYLFP